MKRSSIVIAAAAFVVMLSGVVFLARFGGKGNLAEVDKSGALSDSVSPSEVSGKVSFGEFRYEIAANDIVCARYVRIGSANRIYSVSPVRDTSGYDITSDGSRAVCLGKDGHIWALFNDGNCKKLTPDKYGSVSIADLHKQSSSYIWADEPVFESNGIVRFISDLPSSESCVKKSIWEISVGSGDMKMLYTLDTDSYRVLGYDDDGMLLVLDGSTLASVNTEDGTVSKAETGDKQILSMSPDGSKMIYVKRNKLGSADWSALYMMGSGGTSSVKLPGIQGYQATSTGLWNSDGNEYLFIAKSLWNSRDRIGLIEFGEDRTEIKSFAPGSDIRFPDDCRLSWSGGDSVDVDTGDDIISVSMY